MNRLGAHWDGEATRFTVFSAHAEAVTLCLFDNLRSHVARRHIPLEASADGLWSARAADAQPGQLYAYRVQGRWAPQLGHRFNPSKLLIDPMAAAVTGEPDLHPSLFSFPPGAEEREEREFNSDESAAYMPKCVVVDQHFDWQGVEAPRIPWRDTVIYECHVRGLTRCHPDIEEGIRGTYLALAAPPVLDHLKRLGVTAVELMPVQHFASEPHLQRRGLRNYWGYNPLAFCAPYSGYATAPLGHQVVELKTMVRELHRAGLEVILDVVFNHNAEGDHRGPVLSLKGLDNHTYFRLHPRKKARYLDYTGCGNTLDAGQPAVRRLILESLRYWVREMRVDGFRLDLATTLGRNDGLGAAFETAAPLFRSIAEDPDLARAKLIVEPWDVGPEGYRLGQFPRGWREWNDRYRDTVRGYWRGDQGALGDLATCLTGSRDVFANKGPLTSVNFLTSHDGFTLADAVSYRCKRNLANGEENSDGPADDTSHNWGHEGPTDDVAIKELRRRARYNLLATLALSHGVPMVLAGDELGRTQRGNNNAYCQDNEISWIDWRGDREAASLTEFLRQALALRRRYPALRGGRFATRDEILWWHPCGRPMLPADWRDRHGHALAAGILGGEGGRHAAADLLLLVNAAPSPVRFELAAMRSWGSRPWRRLLDTARDEAPARSARLLTPPAKVSLPPYSLCLYAIDRRPK